LSGNPRAVDALLTDLPQQSESGEFHAAFRIRAAALAGLLLAPAAFNPVGGPATWPWVAPALIALLAIAGLAEFVRLLTSPTRQYVVRSNQLLIEVKPPFSVDVLTRVSMDLTNARVLCDINRGKTLIVGPGHKPVWEFDLYSVDDPVAFVGALIWSAGTTTFQGAGKPGLEA